MVKYFFWLILGVTTFTSILAQETYEYLGVIKLPNDTFISYKIAFSENDNVLTGYTLTDLGGAHETKSYLSGYFNDKENEIEFYESSIAYTKSFVNQNDFCYVNFKGKLKNLNDRQQISGNFKGLYSDGKECISGEILAKNFKGILKKAKKIDKKVSRSILIPKEKKEQVHLVKDLDSINTSTLNKEETLSVFVKGDSVQLSLYDAGQEDGDEIQLFLNGKIWKNKLLVSNKKQRFDIPLKNQTKIELTIKALNNGSIGGNTVKLEINNSNVKFETLSNLQKNESTYIHLLKK